MSPLWQAEYSLVSSHLLGWNCNCSFFSVHICVNRIHLLHCPCEMPPFLVVRTCFSYADPTLPVFQDPAVKLTNEDQAKLKTQVTSTIQIYLSPSSRVTGLSHQSRQFVWVARIKPGFPACGDPSCKATTELNPPSMLHAFLKLGLTLF